ncbi:hypothetical protein HY500_01150 [Candidatus Woesearchaeota archaeon]|nr:hypothetical protein [Candidatus Woesearchaeota archaeon]
MSRASSGTRLQDRVGYFLNLGNLEGHETEVSVLIGELYKLRYNGWANALLTKATSYTRF